jgi:hypothetical protein
MLIGSSIILTWAYSWPQPSARQQMKSPFNVTRYRLNFGIMVDTTGIDWFGKCLCGRAGCNIPTTSMAVNQTACEDCDGERREYSVASIHCQEHYSVVQGIVSSPLLYAVKSGGKSSDISR